MAQDQNQVTTSRRWPLHPVGESGVDFWVKHKLTTQDPGLPTEATVHEYEAELQVGRTRTTFGVGATQAEFDDVLNTLRQAIVDARAGLPTL